MESEKLNELLKTFPSLLPLHGKKPFEKDWQRWCEKERPFDPVDFKGCNVGLPCGPANGILVLDADHVIKMNEWFKQRGYTLPQTRMHITGSGKPHYFYGYPNNGTRYGCRSVKDPEGEIDPKTGKVITIFDVRGVGGQVVGPGSIHPDTKKPYTVRYDGPIEPAPQWLLDFASHEETPKQAVQSQGSCEKWDGELENLPVSYATRKLIFDGEVQGKRSEAVMAGVNALVAARLSDEAIFSVFEKYPIGEKYREKGNAKRQWLQRHIDKAKDFVTLKASDVVVEDVEFIPMSTAMDLDFIQRPAVVEDIMPFGSHILVSGETGVGKSLLRLQLSLHIAFGRDWLGFKIPEPRKVAVFQYENTTQMEYTRTRKMCQALGIKELAGRIVSVDRKNRVDLKLKGDRKKFLEMVKQSEAEVIFYDCLSNFHSVDENKNIEMRQVLDTFSEINAILDTSCLVVHHFGKPTEYQQTRYRTRGAQSIVDWSVTAMAFTVKPHEHKELRRLEVIKARDCRIPKPMLLERDDDFLLHEVDEDTLCSPGKVKEILIELGGSVERQKDLLDAIIEDTKCVKRTAIKFIKSAVTACVIKERNEGRTTRYFVD